MRHSSFDDEVDRNFESLSAQLSELLAEHAGEFALMRGGAIVEYHGTEAGALAIGRERFPDGIFSIQEITTRPADLGFFSHAIDTRLA